MGLNKLLQDYKIIAVDTPIFIYYIEENLTYHKYLEQLFNRSVGNKNSIRIVTSVITLIEVLVKPIKENRVDIANKYKEIFLSSENLILLPVENEIAEKSADLRAKYRFLRTPDAIQIASALFYRAECFVSNDKQLEKVKEINYILLSELIKQ